MFDNSSCTVVVWRKQQQMRIKVRHRKLRGGPRETVYLDYYDKGRRWLEYLELYLGGTRACAKKDKETLAVAETIAHKRRLEYACEEHDLPQRGKLKADFVAY